MPPDTEELGVGKRQKFPSTRLKGYIVNSARRPDTHFADTHQPLSPHDDSVVPQRVQGTTLSH